MGTKTYILLLDEVRKNFSKITSNNKKFQIRTIKHTTNGQLLSLKELLKSNIKLGSFFVSSADYRFRINKKSFEKFINKNNPDVVIFTTQWKYFAHAQISNYGFVKINNNKKILEIIEKPKIKISDQYLNNLLIGSFWFRNTEIVNLLPNFTNENNEVFIASAINKLIKDIKLYSFEVDYWRSLGTPKELDLAKYWFDFFKNESTSI